MDSTSSPAKRRKVNPENVRTLATSSSAESHPVYFTNMEYSPSMALHQARCLTQACLEVNDNASAAWYADKACSLGSGSPCDLFSLATVYYKSGEYHRAWSLLEHHALIDLEKQSNPLCAKRKPLTSVHDNGAQPQSELCTVPPLYHGAVKPDALRFFHLAATCLAALGQWERCVMLLEGCMEGPGHAGLRVPLKVPSPDVATQLLPSTATGKSTDATGKTSASGLRSKGLFSPDASAKPSSAPAEWAPLPGLDGEPPRGAGEENYEPNMAATTATGTKGGLTPGRTRSATAAMRAAASASSGTDSGKDPTGSSLAGGLAVWHTIRHMALQHNEQVAVACGNGQTGITLHVPADIFSNGYVPCGSGLGGINIVAAMCNVRARALLALDNRLRAAQWFIAALRCDPYCTSALQSLIDNCLLSCQEEERLSAYLQAVLSPTSSTPQRGPGQQVQGLHHVHAGPKAMLAAQMYSDLFKAGSAAREISSAGTATVDQPPHAPLVKEAQGRARQGSVDSQGTHSSAGTAHSHLSSGAGPSAHTSSATLQRTKSGRMPPTPAAAFAPALAGRAATSGKSATPAAFNANCRSSSVDASDPSADVGGQSTHAPGRAQAHENSPGMTLTVHLGWLRDLYCCRLGRYSLSTPIQGRFYPLEHSEHCAGLGTAGAGRVKANLDVQTAKAEALLAQQDYDGAYSLTKAVLAVDPHHPQACLVHFTVLTALKKAPELFSLAHAAVHSMPRAALSWYGVGCYYLCLGRLSAASRHFTQSTVCDKSFAPAWIGLGMSYAGQEEIEPALQAYRTAMRLSPNSHIAPLAMASICIKTNSLALARQYLEMAYTRCPYDPLVYHEVGVLEWRKGGKDSVVEATKYWEEALKLISGLPAHTRAAHEATYYCLGHAYRKLGLFEDSIEAYSASLALQPGKASTLAALAFVNLLAGYSVRAVELCHAVLAQGTDDPFVSKVLRCALGEVLDAPPAPSVTSLRAPTASARAQAASLSQRISKIMAAADDGSLQLPLVQGAPTHAVASSPVVAGGAGGTGTALHRSAMDISAIAGGVGASMILGVTGLVSAPAAVGRAGVGGRPASAAPRGPGAGTGRVPPQAAMQAHDQSQVLSELHEGDMSLSSTPGSGMMMVTPEQGPSAAGGYNTAHHGYGGAPSSAVGSYGRTAAAAPGVGSAAAPPVPPPLPRRGGPIHTPAPTTAAAGGARGGRAVPPASAVAAGISPIPDFSAIISPDATGIGFSLGMTGTRLWDTSGASASASAPGSGVGAGTGPVVATPVQGGQGSSGGTGRAHMPGSSAGGRFSLDRELAGMGVQMVASPELGVQGDEGEGGPDEEEDEELAHSAFRSANGDQGQDAGDGSASGMELEMSDYELAARLQQEEMADLAATQHSVATAAAAAAAVRTPSRNVSVRNMSARRVQSITPTGGQGAGTESEGGAGAQAAAATEGQAGQEEGEGGGEGYEEMDYAALPVIPGYTPEEVAQLIASGAFDDMGFGEEILGAGGDADYEGEDGDADGGGQGQAPGGQGQVAPYTDAGGEGEEDDMELEGE